jgi:uncharacterized membrane protein YuzA (DUF378 family)
VTNSARADPGQDGSPANLPSPLQSVDDMRTTAKWTITALGAVGVALLGAAPLTAVGKIHGFGQTAEALAGLIIGLAGIGWAIWHTTDALMPPATTLATISPQGPAGLEAEISDNRAAFFGPYGNSVQDLENACVFWQAAAAQATVMLAAEHDDNRKRRLTQAVSDAQANAAQVGARLRWLLEFAHAWRVREQLRRARLHAFAGSAVTALGAMIFVASTTRLPYWHNSADTARGTFTRTCATGPDSLRLSQGRWANPSAGTDADSGECSD